MEEEKPLLTPQGIREYAARMGWAEDFGPTPLRPGGFTDEQIQAWIDNAWPTSPRGEAQGKPAF